MILALLLAAQTEFAERKLATLPDGARLQELFVTTDGTAAAYAFFDGKKVLAVRGEWRTKPYDMLRLAALSPDGRHVLYITFDDSDRLHRLWLDERLIQTIDARDGLTWHSLGALSRNGSVAVLMIGSAGKEWRTYSVNGKNGTPHTLQHLTPPKLSLDGKTIAGQGTTLGNSFRVILNDVAGPVYDNLAGPAVSENGIVAYVGEKPDGSLELRHGDKVSRLEGLMPEDVFISADGLKLGYVLSDKGVFVRVDAKTYPKLKRVNHAAFDARGQKVVFWGLEGDKNVVGIEDRVFDAPGIVTPPIFSPDGTKVGYGTQIGQDLIWKVIDAK
ncbi:MAG TPA: hypothetical protein VF950_03595 [Planctomycetota bacterium]